jgi:tetratricopeptide (TPR) repeat protein
VIAVRIIRKAWPLLGVLAALSSCIASAPPGRVRVAYQRPAVELYAFEHFNSREGKPCPRLEAGAAAPELAAVPIASVESPPERLSEKFHEVIMDAEARYEKKEFKQAAELLEPVYRAEPGNRFVTEAYARNLFRLGDYRRSMELYTGLVNGLDEKKSCRAKLLIDPWFMDAYWKKGLMHLALREWRPAAFEISRAYNNLNHPLLVDQALSYLTAAFFNLGDHDVAWYYAQQALRHNPNNQYVLKYVEAMNLGVKK